MLNSKTRIPHLSVRTRLAAGAAVLLAVGAAGGAGAVSLTRPTIEMAPTVPTGIAGLSAATGIVTVKGKVVETHGDRFVLQDKTGRTMVDAGRDHQADIKTGQQMLVQGRFDDGQMRAAFLVGPGGKVDAVGPLAGRDPHGPHGPRHPGGPDGPDGPGGPDARGPGAPPPPPPGGPRADATGGPGPRPGADCPAPPTGAAPPLAPNGATPPPPAPQG